MNLPSILVGVALIVALIAAIGFMNKGNGPCGGNCNTCAMSEHCERLDEEKAKKKNQKEDI